MVMFLSVGLVRRMSMFMDDSNLQMWEKRKTLCVVFRAGGFGSQLKEKNSATTLEVTD